MESEITCIICPVGCKVVVHQEGKKITHIEGYECKKGIEYAKEELFDPKRTLTTTVMVKYGELPLVSVKTKIPIPKDKLFDIMNLLSQIEVDAPINIGDVLVEKIIDLDADIVATKNVKRMK